MTTRKFHNLALKAAAILIALVAVPAAAQFAPLPDEPALGERAGGKRGDPQIPGCVVGLVNKIELPATEAGVLVYLGVKEGSAIRQEEVIAQIDDREARQLLRIAEFSKEAAEARADDNVEIEYNQAAALVSRVDWEEMNEANRQVDGAVPEADVRRARLEYDRSRLGEKKARKDQQLARLDARVKEAELEAARLAIAMREIRAPFDGEVLEVTRHQQEWVQPGEVIAVVAQLDTLQVDGFVYFDQYDPSQVDGCEVTIDVAVGRGRVVQATGRVVYIDPVAVYEKRHKYLVRAEIANRRENGRWLISPNLSARMTIHLGSGGAQSAMNDAR